MNKRDIHILFICRVENQIWAYKRFKIDTSVQVLVQEHFIILTRKFRCLLCKSEMTELIPVSSHVLNAELGFA